MKTYYEDPTHVHPYLPEGVNRLFQLTGFRDVHVELFYHHELMWNSRLWRGVGSFLRLFLSTARARQLSALTDIKFFRWAVEQNILGVGYK